MSLPKLKKMKMLIDVILGSIRAIFVGLLFVIPMVIISPLFYLLGTKQVITKCYHFWNQIAFNEDTSKL